MDENLLQGEQGQPGSVVDERKLEEGAEDKALAHARPHVDSLGVGHRRQLGVDPARLGRHGQEGGDPQGDAGGDGVLVQPEGDPGDDDEHAAGHVDGDKVVGKFSLEYKLHF